MRRVAWAAAISAAWSLVVLGALNAWNFTAWRAYQNCTAESFRPAACAGVFYGGQPTFRCARALDKITGCEDDGSAHPCNIRTLRVCSALLPPPAPPSPPW